MPSDTKIQAYADDTLILAGGEDRETCRRRAETAVHRVLEWMRGAGLEVAEAKTEMVLFSGPRWSFRRAPLFACIGTQLVESTRHMKYLGVCMDDKLNYGVLLPQLRSARVSFKVE